jgi:2'-5' RNA ligase
MLRTFVALELPPEVKRVVTALQQAGPRDVRWVDPEGAHVTLKFLGPTAEDAVPRIGEALARAAGGFGPLRLTTAGIGRFPRALWLGLEGEVDRLVALRDAVEREVSPLGWPTDDRPFRAHLTLGRLRSEAAGATPIEPPPPLAFEASEVALMQSELSPKGARYSRLLAVPLTPS